jgi:hypothetical protein
VEFAYAPAMCPCLCTDALRLHRRPCALPSSPSPLGLAPLVASAIPHSRGQQFFKYLKPESERRPGVTMDSLVAEINTALRMPGISNAWTMPIKARINMLSTSIRTPVGVKVYGPDLAGIDRLSRRSRLRSGRCPARPAPSPSGSRAATTGLATDGCRRKESHRQQIPSGVIDVGASRRMGEPGIARASPGTICADRTTRTLDPAPRPPPRQC